MSLVNKRKFKRVSKKRSSSYTIFMREIDAQDTLFPEKVARAKEVLSKIEIDPDLFRKK
jgi:hypothetical protein